jgi:hypothetical protein
MAETKVPALPEPSTVKDPHLRRLLASMKEALDIRLGRRGDSLDRAVTLRELYENGVVTISGRGVELKLRNDFSLNTPRIPTTPPPAPKNLTAQGAFTHVLLQWTIPRYAYHALTEIWRSEVDDLSTAQLVGVSSSEVYADPVDTARGYYYWVRFKSQADVTGPYNGTSGTYAETAVPPAEILDALEGQITETHLHSALTGRISSVEAGLSQEVLDRIAAVSAEADARGAAILAEQVARQDADASIAADVTALESTVNDPTTGVAATAAGLSALDTRVTTTEGQVSSQATQITQLQSTVDNIPPGNLLDPRDWVLGTTGSQGPFAQNGTSTENSIILSDGPTGATENVWRAVAVPNNYSDGGWNHAVEIDHTKTYRSVVFIKKVTNRTDGHTYHGCGGGLTYNLSGTANGNPYFWAGHLPELGKWYMLVGVIHGSGYTGGDTGVAGVYDCETSEKVLDGTEFKNAPGATTQTHRAYLYYSTLADTEQHFARPRFEVMDGSEPSLGALMAGQLNTAYIAQQMQSIDGVLSQWTIKTDVNGRVAGVGLMNDGVTSSFEVLADNFSIFHPSASDSLVFGVSGGKTVMNGAYIEDATITDAKIANISADKISAATLSAISANMGTITAGKLQSVDGRVAIDMTLGTFSVKSGTSGARLEIKDNAIKVYDENGVLRVKLGDLSA